MKHKNVESSPAGREYALRCRTCQWSRTGPRPELAAEDLPRVEASVRRDAAEHTRETTHTVEGRFISITVYRFSS